MIEIYDTDMPITVADKIITGTKPFVATPLARAIAKTITGSETATITGSETADDSIDMFDIDEIKEIVDYLMVYYESHKEGD